MIVLVMDGRLILLHIFLDMHGGSIARNGWWYGYVWRYAKTLNLLKDAISAQ